MDKSQVKRKTRLLLVLAFSRLGLLVFLANLLSVGFARKFGVKPTRRSAGCCLSLSGLTVLLANLLSVGFASKLSSKSTSRGTGCWLGLSGLLVFLTNLLRVGFGLLWYKVLGIHCITS
jgi:hypothetical protein